MGLRNKDGVKRRGQARRTLKSQKRLVYIASPEADEWDYWITERGAMVAQERRMEMQEAKTKPRE